MAQTEKPVPIRERQTQLTKQAILESLAEIIVEEGPLGFSVQNVADRAGVSHRTVYRHFPNREAMCEGVIEWSEQRASDSKTGTFPNTLEGVMAMLPTVFAEFESDRMLFQSLVLLNLSTGFRAGASRLRDRQIEEMIMELAPSISDEERKRGIVLVRYLGSSLSWMGLTTQYNRTDLEAAQTVVYGIRLVLQDLKRLERKAKKEM